jgi:uncharacterized protein (DUF885 family)
LSFDDQISHGILSLMLEEQSESLQISACTFGVTPYDSALQAAGYGLNGFSISTTADADIYLKLLATLPTYIKQVQSNLARKAANGISLPKDYIPYIAAPLAEFGKLTTDSPFSLSSDRLASLPKAKAARIERAVNSLIASKINPALTSLAAYISGPYAAKAPVEIGMGQTPACAEVYKKLIRFETTTELQPDEIHELGLAQVAEIKIEMANIQKKLGFSGTPQAFWVNLQTKPELKSVSKEAIASNMQKHADFIAARMPQMFAGTIKAKGVARPLPQDREAGETFGNYVTPTATEAEGIYSFNGANELKSINITHEGLIAHELYPGHHYQSMLVIENNALSVFRKSYGNSAYAEGWAEYAARVVAKELGALNDPYSRYGSLSDELFLASRLVVDTGMNAKGWSLQKARAYMKENTFKTDDQIATETLRYGAAMPGQALGYRLGHIAILQLRRKLEAEMGAAFDIKRFHSAMLRHGALPMFMLEKVARQELANGS